MTDALFALRPVLLALLLVVPFAILTAAVLVTLFVAPITLPDTLQVGEAIGYPSGYDFAGNGFVTGVVLDVDGGLHLT